MQFMDWALETATKHPELKDSFVTVDGDSLDILLHDGRSFRFRPQLLLDMGGDPELHEKLLNRLISIGIKHASHPQPAAEQNSEAASDSAGTESGVPTGDAADAAFAVGNENALTAPAPPGTAGIPAPDNSHILPILRDASYFLTSHTANDSYVYLPLTEFLAAGIVHDSSAGVRPIYYSETESDPRELDVIVADAIIELYSSSDAQEPALKVTEEYIEGAHTFTVTAPKNYESSWFCDVDILQRFANRLSQQNNGAVPLFVPAAVSKFFIVFDNDPHLVDFFTHIDRTLIPAESIYPLPHTLIDEGWQEWIPLPGTPVAQILGKLRTDFRQKIYATQAAQMPEWGNFGVIKNYEVRVFPQNEYASTVIWSDTDQIGSVPDTDFVTFVLEPSPHPWEAGQARSFTVRSYIAREIWEDGFTRDLNLWPPRWRAVGFPDPDTLQRLQQSAITEN